MSANLSSIVKNIPAIPAETYGAQSVDSLIEVDTGSFEVSTSPMISEGFFNCIAVIGLSRNLALLGHFQNIDIPGSGSYENFGIALKKLVEMEADSVILAGGGMSKNPVDVEYASADRTFAEAAVRATMPSATLEVIWNEEENTPKDIVVFPNTRTVAIHNSWWSEDRM